MRTSAGASTPSRTWLPRTSRTRTVTASPTRITSPNFLVRTSIALPVPPSGEQLPEQLAQELPRHVLDVGAVGALGHHAAEPGHLLLPQDIEGAHLRLEAGEQVAHVRDADPVRGASAGSGHTAGWSTKALMKQDFRLIDFHRSSPGWPPAGSPPVYRHGRSGP